MCCTRVHFLRVTSLFNENVRHNPQPLNPSDKVAPSVAAVVILDLITAK